MYTYCANNPLIFVDPSGHNAVAISDTWSQISNVVSTVADSIGNSFKSYSQAYGACGAVALVDSPAPGPADALAGVAAILITGAALISGINDAVESLSSSQRHGVKENFTSTCQDPYLAPWIDGSLSLEENWARNWQMADAKAKDDADSIGKSIDIPYWPIKKPAYFPEDPNDFQPLGLTPVYREGTKNGSIIQWNSPLTNKPVFTWHENSNHDDGSHYHINDLDIGLPSKYHTHFYPGTLVPYPYSSIYF